MKNITIYSLIIAVAIFVGGCKGAQGDVGPIGAAGTAGKTGTNGTAGATGANGATGATGDAGATGAAGNKGATGDPGTKGDAGSISMTYSDWKPLIAFKKNADLANFYYYSDDTSIDYLKLIPTGSKVALFREFGNHIITNSSGNTIGFLYTYYKISENSVDIVFPERLNREPVDISSNSLGGSLLSTSVSFYFNKNTFTEKSDLAKEITDRKPNVRLVFLPLALKNGRMAHVDMTNYEDVKRVYNLRD